MVVTSCIRLVGRVNLGAHFVHSVGGTRRSTSHIRLERTAQTHARNMPPKRSRPPTREEAEEIKRQNDKAAAGIHPEQPEIVDEGALPEKADEGGNNEGLEPVPHQEAPNAVPASPAISDIKAQVKEAEQQLAQAVAEKKAAQERERAAFNREASNRGYVRMMPKEQREGKALQKQAEQKLLKLCANRKPSDKQCESFEDEFENKVWCSCYWPGGDCRWYSCDNNHNIRCAACEGLVCCFPWMYDLSRV